MSDEWFKLIYLSCILISILLFVWLLNIFYDKKTNTQKNVRYDIVKIKNCEYILYRNLKNDDLEHYAGCHNPIHNNTTIIDDRDRD